MFRRLAVLALFVSLHVLAAPPTLYHQGAYESPTRGDPDDLIVLSGYGLMPNDTVVYQAIHDTTRPLTQPGLVPSQSARELGIAPIVSAAAPYSLTVKLPQTMQRDQSYALWIRTLSGEWSQGVKINDARPLWFTPSFVHVSSMPGSLPREMKIIGRNLQPAPGHVTQVRLVGPQQPLLEAVSNSPSSETMNEYVARVVLPGKMPVGRYQVQLSRDGQSWLTVPDQSFDVLPEPPISQTFPLGDPRYGSCRPDDGRDDTVCLIRAIAAAKSSGGGTIRLSPGTWDLIDSEQPGLMGDDGLVVPAGVNLRGDGASNTRLVRHQAWTDRRPSGAAVTLVGHSTVSGLTFKDQKKFDAHDRAGPFIQLGEHYDRVAARNEPGIPIVEDVVISENTFDKTMVAIGNGGLPISRAFITYNTFGSFRSSLEFAGNGYNTVYKFGIDDAVVAYNRFEPGSEMDLIEKSGTLASELGAGHRVDFSDNTADGSSAAYLYSSDDPAGWRAAFFWNMNGNIEEVLVSQNSASCTGDKLGDGEAIAFDDNANTFALASISPVTAAASDSIEVSQPLVSRQNRRDVPIGTYYLGHWVQIVDGPGRGQTRKILAYSTDLKTGRTVFQVSPDWDVVPAAGISRIAVGRQLWQVYTLDNTIDNRKPLCRKSNRTRHNAGAITMWSQSADSVIAGNHQYDSDGIFVHQIYILPDRPCTDCNMDSLFQYFLEIRNNVVDGEYDWAVDCSTSGIAVGAAATPYEAKPPAVGLGVSISHNTVRHADGERGGGISQLGTWFAGPEPQRWPLSDGLIIQHNTIADIGGPSPAPVCGTGVRRVGISFPAKPIAWRTVLYKNSCKNVATPLGGGAIDPRIICPDVPLEDSCECPVKH